MLPTAGTQLRTAPLYPRHQTIVVKEVGTGAIGGPHDPLPRPTVFQTHGARPRQTPPRPSLRGRLPRRRRQYLRRPLAIPRVAENVPGRDRRGVPLQTPQNPAHFPLSLPSASGLLPAVPLQDEAQEGHQQGHQTDEEGDQVRQRHGQVVPDGLRRDGRGAAEDGGGGPQGAGARLGRGGVPVQDCPEDFFDGGAPHLGELG
mmetsp:Transcript_7273/g.15759  ORF Transcript_7273/g.15759 Transcript_7273/m.15759 type:complete len:202 (-) Transcript_7273:311-916(-)